MTDSLDPIVSQFVVCCHTEGCTNEGLYITITAPKDDPTVWCGPCSQPITDIVEEV